MFVEDYLLSLTLVSAADFKEQHFILTPQLLQNPPTLTFPYRAWFKLHFAGQVLAAGGFTPENNIQNAEGNLLINYYASHNQADPILTTNIRINPSTLQSILRSLHHNLPPPLQNIFH